MTRWIFAAAAAAALAGCGGEAPAPETTAVPADNAATDNVVAENVQATVLSMSDAERNVVLIRALLDADLACQRVESSERVDDRDGMPTWRANCSEGTSHLVSFSADGTAYTQSRTD